MINKIIAGLVGGIFVGLLGGLLYTIATADADTGIIVTWVLAIIGFVIALTSLTASKAWRKLLIASSLMSFSMPLASLINTGSQIVEVSENADAAGFAGTVIGGGMATALIGFIGFFLGIIFLIIGLLVDRDKQVVIIDKNTSTIKG